MSKKRKKELRWQPQQEFWEGLSTLGITSEEEYYDFVFDNDDIHVLREVENGYVNRYMGIFGKQTISPETLSLAEYKSQYIVYVLPCSEGEYSEEGSNVVAQVFDTLQEAEVYFEKCKGINYKSIWEEIHDCKAAMRDDVWIKIEGYPSRLYFKIYFQRNMILDHIYDLDAERFQAQIDHFKAWEKELAEYGMHVDHIWKEKEFPGNQRYYVFDLFSNIKGWVTFRKHIKSMYQNKERDVLGFFDFQDIVDLGITKDKAQAQTAQDEAQYKAVLEEIKMRAEKPLLIHKDEFQKLYDYLATFELSCDGTLQNTEQWLKENIPTNRQAQIPDMLDELRCAGGYCDCEVCLNCREFYENHF